MDSGKRGLPRYPSPPHRTAARCFCCCYAGSSRSSPVGIEETTTEGPIVAPEPSRLGGPRDGLSQASSLSRTRR